MPANTHLFQSSFNVLHHVFSGLNLFLPPSSGTQDIAVGAGLSLQSEDVASHFPSPCSNNVLESKPGRSTLKVLKYKYKYFPPPKYLSTSTFNLGGMYSSTFRVLSKCT